MSREPAASARSTSAASEGFANVCPNTSRPQPQSRTTPSSVGTVAVPTAGSSPVMLTGSPPGPTLSRRRTSSGPTAAPRPGASSGPGGSADPMGLQPHLEEPELPELVAGQGGEVLVRVGHEL